MNYLLGYLLKHEGNRLQIDTIPHSARNPNKFLWAFVRICGVPDHSFQIIEQLANCIETILRTSGSNSTDHPIVQVGGEALKLAQTDRPLPKPGGLRTTAEQGK